MHTTKTKWKLFPKVFLSAFNAIAGSIFTQNLTHTYGNFMSETKLDKQTQTSSSPPSYVCRQWQQMPAQIPPSMQPSLNSPVRIDQAIPYMLSQHICYFPWHFVLRDIKLSVASKPDFVLLELSKFTQNPKHLRQMIPLAGTQMFAVWSLYVSILNMWL